MRFPEVMTRVRLTGGAPGRTDGRDPFGDRAPTASADRLSFRGAFAPGSTSEDRLQRGETVFSTATAYAPHGTDVRSSDQVEARGRTWEVDGDPAVWQSPGTGRRAGVAINLRAVRG